jgi:hypothetical protein
MKETFWSRLRELWAIRQRCQQIKVEQRLDAAVEALRQIAAVEANEEGEKQTVSYEIATAALAKLRKEIARKIGGTSESRGHIGFRRDLRAPETSARG